MNEHKRWVSEIFDRTASEYGQKSSSFFSYFGKRLVEQVNVLPDQHVLDIATGRGAVLYREMQLNEKLKSMSEEDAILLLHQHGMLVKRPFLLGDDFGLLGFKEAEWSKAI